MIEYSKGERTVSAKVKVLASGLVGVATLFVAAHMYSWRLSPLLAWDAAAFIYLVWTWQTIWPMKADLTASHAVREDPSRAAADTAVLVASLASLAAVVLALVEASTEYGNGKLVLVAFSVISIIISWVVVHTLFTLHYAELYYRGVPGGVDFPKTPRPSYKDFTYLAFTIGMTFQVSDTGFQNTDFRRTALRHSLVSYLFGTVIVATTINLIAGLTK